VPDRNGKIFYTSITSLSHISKKARLEAERKATAEKAEQRRKEELSQKKRKLAFERNNIQFEYFMANADSDDWNSDYSNYLILEKILILKHWKSYLCRF